MSGLAPVSFRKGRASAPRLSAPYVPGRRHERYWTEEEKEIIRDHFARDGAAACVVRLPGRNLRTVYQQAQKLGVRSVKQPEGVVRRRWHTEGPPDLDERIRTAWPGLSAKGAVGRFADGLGVPRWVVSKRATKLGLTKAHKKEPRWTQAEEDLMRRVPLHDPDRASAIFRQHGFVRSPTAIVVRAKRLDLSRRTHETLSGRAVGRLLGVDDKWVTARCISGALKAGRRGSKRLPQQGGDAWAIEPADLRAYVVANLDEIDIRKVEKFAFVALLAGEADRG